MKVRSQEPGIRGRESGARSWTGKYMFMLFLIISFTVVGCAGTQVQIDQDGQEVIAKITGRRVGSEIAKKYPDIAREVLALSKAIIVADEPDIIAIVVKRVAVLLSGEVDDPLLAADISDILDRVKIETDVGITTEQITIVKAVAEGLASGIEIQRLKSFSIAGDKKREI